MKIELVSTKKKKLHRAAPNRMSVQIIKKAGNQNSDFADLVVSFFIFFLSLPVHNLGVKYIIKPCFFGEKNCHRLSLKRIMACKIHVIPMEL